MIMEKLKSILYWGDFAANPKLPRRAHDFTHVRLHHFCRPSTFDSYKERGICPFSHEQLVENFHRLFSDIPEEKRQSAINAVTRVKLRPRVDAALDDRYMIAIKNHYAMYGSEMILALTNHLPRGKDYRQRLIDMGKPAMIVFDAPVEELEDSATIELDMDLKLLETGSFENFHAPDHHIDFTASFFKNVPSEWIVEYRWL